jgi:hypothetical protein
MTCDVACFTSVDGSLISQPPQSFVRIITTHTHIHLSTPLNKCLLHICYIVLQPESSVACGTDSLWLRPFTILLYLAPLKLKVHKSLRWTQAIQGTEAPIPQNLICSEVHLFTHQIYIMKRPVLSILLMHAFVRSCVIRSLGVK